MSKRTTSLYAMTLMLLGLLLFVFFSSQYHASKAHRSEYVEQEIIYCISAVCSGDARTGGDCTYFPAPQVTSILIAVDESGQKKIHINSTGTECR